MKQHKYRLKQTSEINDMMINKVRFTKNWSYYENRVKEFDTYLDSFLEYEFEEFKKEEKVKEKTKDQRIKEKIKKLEVEIKEEEEK